MGASVRPRLRLSPTTHMEKDMLHMVDILVTMVLDTLLDTTASVRPRLNPTTHITMDIPDMVDFLDTMFLVTLESTMVKKMHTTWSLETGNQVTCGTHKYGICKLKQSS